jgi:predicted phosphodiesterase
VRLGLFADVHANAGALEAVLLRFARERVDRLVCLGDLVGYNAEPRLVIDRLRESGAVLVAGNHDRDALRDLPMVGTTSAAAAAMRWTAEALGPGERAFLAGLPNRHVEPGLFVAIHGSFLNDVHTYGYVTSTMLKQNLDVVSGRADLPALAFCGHTHVPMFGALDRDGECSEVRELAAPVAYAGDARAVPVNPGSVGQPRDGDPRAGFAIADTVRREVTICRTGYDIERARMRILQEGLPEILAQRLALGR